VQSPIIESDDLLHSFIEINANSKDLALMTNVQVYEDLTTTNNNDRYQFIYPNFNLEKQYGYNSLLDGNFRLNTSGYNKQYNTNVNEKVFINDLFFNTIPKTSPEGFRTSKTFLLKNTNTDSENSSAYKDSLNNKLDTMLEYKASFPLIKKEREFIDIINPLMKFRFSPNKSEDLSKSDKRLDINNIYSFNRLGTSTSVEGGASLTYGVEYLKLDELENELYSAKIANVFRPNSDDRLPENNGLNKKTSDIIGQINLNPNKYFKTTYDFSVDENLEDQNYQLINSQIKINNFVTSFEFLDNKSSIVKSSYLSNTTKIVSDDNSKSLIFNTRENKTTNATEFYNLLYQYRNDCLIAALEYNKDYYNAGGLKPEENIFFKLTIVPFGQTSTPNLKP
jgi:LPS-assembly protein